jgi:trimethylamine corrinoid protein
MLDAVIKAYDEAVFDTDKAAFRVVNEALARGISPEDIVSQVVIPAIEEMTSRIGLDPDTNLAQHFMTAQIASEVTEEMLEKFRQPSEIVGKTVIGNAYGDLHSRGKRIVIGCLKSLMVDVVDLGVNVAAERFVDLPLERLDVNLDHLESVLADAIDRKQHQLGC